MPCVEYDEEINGNIITAIILFAYFTKKNIAIVLISYIYEIEDFSYPSLQLRS